MILRTHFPSGFPPSCFRRSKTQIPVCMFLPFSAHAAFSSTVGYTNSGTANNHYATPPPFMKSKLKVYHLQMINYKSKDVHTWGLNSGRELIVWLLQGLFLLSILPRRWCTASFRPLLYGQRIWLCGWLSRKVKVVHAWAGVHPFLVESGSMYILTLQTHYQALVHGFDLSIRGKSWERNLWGGPLDILNIQISPLHASSSHVKRQNSNWSSWPSRSFNAELSKVKSITIDGNALACGEYFTGCWRR